MRIVIHGQEAFGKAVLEALLERGENVVGVYCAPDKEGRPEGPCRGRPLCLPKTILGRHGDLPLQ